MNDEQKSLLVDARSREDWTFLWQAGVPLVKLAMRRLMEDGHLDPYYSREDLLQDGYLAAGEAVRRWEPEQGAFSTWVVAWVSGELLKSITAASTGMVGGRDNGYYVASMSQDEAIAENADDERKDVGIEASLAYAEPPETLGDPADEANRMSEVEYVRELLASMPEFDREVLTFAYGLLGEELTQEEIARLLHVTSRTVRTKIAHAEILFSGLARNSVY